MKSLNIIYHHRTQGRGAEGTHIMSIVKAFEELGHNVTIISPPGIDPRKEIGAPPVDKTKVKTSGVQSIWKIISKYLPNPFFELMEIAYNVPAYRKLKKEMQNKDYDFIFERYAFFLIAGSRISRKYKIPIIVEANEVSGIKDRARKQTFSRVCEWFESMLFQQAKAVFTVSSQLKRMIIDKEISADKVHVLPNAIDMSIAGISPDGNILRSSYNLDNRFVIGFAGWFDNWDRLDFLLDVFRDIHGKHSDIAICLIGDGPALNGIRKIVNENDLSDSVVLTGAVPKKDIFRYLSILDVAILPHSNNFGSPVIMFEMMSQKKPIVAPKLPPIEDVLEDRKHALLFSPLDKESCIEALLDYYTSPELRKNCANKSYDLLLKEHTWANNSRKIVAAAISDIQSTNNC